jgi:hypothetical protein
MKPNNRIIAGLALAIGCLTAIAIIPAACAEMNPNGDEVLASGPLTGPSDAPGAQSGLRNLRDSGRYEWLVHSNPNFRAVREPKECGPTDDAPMHADCNPSLGR